MATSTSKYIVTLGMNSDEAQRKLAELHNQATGLNKQLTAAMAAGRKGDAGKLRQQLKQVRNDIKRFEDDLKDVDRVMTRLSKASIKEMEGALKTLQRRIKSYDQGSEGFKKMSMQIQSIRQQLSKCNAEMRTQETLWTRMNTWLNNAQTFLIGVIGGLTGMIAAARNAVQQFAQMDEAMANTRKFTGMTEDQVRALNNAFKNMDTRTSREKLNELAQEAGRLGKNTQESVKGYVQAADIINVALSDLGEGATQAIAKLANIFKIEDQYGTYDSMVKIGSVVNVLSQNCTASKPYLVEFANRLAGVGNQAHMSIQDIIGFGAVLDANAQKVEASATAVGQVLTRMYREPAKYAKVAGLDVKEFTKLLKEDANEALLTFLGKLGNAGDLDVLSPMFKDMGENGARVITVLSTLAKHIDEVRWQQKNANEAFEEGTSVLHEYEIFNNTTQAGIDKAKKGFQEMAVALGEKLAPLMRYTYTSGSMFMRVLAEIVNFIIKFRRVILMLVTGLASYYTTLGVLYVLKQKDVIITNAQTAATKAYAVTVEFLKGVLGGLRLVWIALTQGIEAAKVAYTALTATMSINPFGALVAAIGAAVVAFQAIISEQSEFKNKTDELIDNMDMFDSKAQEEQAELDKLFGCLRDCVKGSEDYNNIRKQIMSRYGQYLKGLSSEQRGVVAVADAYNFLSEAIKKAAEARAIAETKKKVTEAYLNDVTKKIGELRYEMEKTGVSGKEIEQILSGVTKAVQNKDIKALENYSKTLYKQSFTTIKGWFSRATGDNADRTVREMSKMMKIHDTQIKVLDKMELNARGNYKAIIPNRNLFGYQDANGNDVPGLLETVGEAAGKGKGINLTLSDKSAYYLGIASKEEINKRHDNGFRAPIDPKYMYDPVRTAHGYEFFYGKNEPIGVMKEPLSNRRVTSHKWTLSPEQTKKFYNELAQEAYIRTDNKEYTPPSDYKEESNNSTYNAKGAGSGAKKEKKKGESDAQRLKKIRKSLQADFEALKKDWEDAYKWNLDLYAKGAISYAEYLQSNRDADEKYIKGRKELLENAKLKETTEYKNLLKEEEDETKKYNKKVQKYLQRQLKTALQHQIDIHNEASRTINSELYNDEMDLMEKLHWLRLHYLEEELKIIEVGTEEYEKKREEIDEENYQHALAMREKLYQKHEEWNQKYAYERAATEMGFELEWLELAKKEGIVNGDQYDKYRKDIVNKAKTESLPEYLQEGEQGSATWSANIKEKKEEDLARLDSLHSQKDLDNTMFMSDEEYEKQKKRVLKHYRAMAIEAAAQFNSEHANMLGELIKSWDDFFNGTEDDAGNWATRFAGVAQAAFAMINSFAQQSSEFMQACSDAELAKASEKYDKYLEYAQGNAFMTKRIEKQKERELAKIKADAAKKTFAFQLASAIAQTAVNAIAAYGAAMEMGPVGLTLAPIAAAMAVAAGMLQVGTIIKQQEASKAQGYAEGGFTPQGSKYQEVGVVHAGEWVASQKLVNNPATRPILEALDYAQRNNRFPQIIDPAIQMRKANQYSGIADNTSYGIRSQSEMAMQKQIDIQNSTVKRLAETIDRLYNRLDEPMAAIVTMTGRAGLAEKQEEYERYINNKSPKYKRITRYASSDR